MDYPAGGSASTPNNPVYQYHNGLAPPSQRTRIIITTCHLLIVRTVRELSPMSTRQKEDDGKNDKWQWWKIGNENGYQLKTMQVRSLILDVNVGTSTGQHHHRHHYPLATKPSSSTITNTNPPPSHRHLPSSLTAQPPMVQHFPGCDERIWVDSWLGGVQMHFIFSSHHIKN